MKKRKRVYYIGWYIDEDDKDSYIGNVPANLKMHYVANKIQEAGHVLTVLSLADRKNTMLYGNFTRRKSKDFKLTYLSGFSLNIRFGRRLNLLIKRIELFLYILFVIKPQDTIIVYHSEVYTRLLASIKMKLDRKVICEVEEIYGYSAQGDDLDMVKREFDSIKKLDSFILINDYLQKELRIAEDNYVPCYGVVNIPERKVNRFEDGYIHIVYAGTIEGRKKGAYQAIEAVEYLPKNFKMHIIGFGRDENIKALKEKISEVNCKQGFEMVVYDGFKSGDDLDQYLYSCHIGISTYVMRETFANHSLPSKIFTYMCHDLAVVRGFAPAYENEDISRNWTFYYGNTPQDVAQAIIQTKVPPVGQNVDYLKACDKRFVDYLKEKC